MGEKWNPDLKADVRRRLGKSPAKLGITAGQTSCPDIVELTNGDFGVIGRRATASYTGRLPGDVSVGADEEFVVIPRVTLTSAKPDIPDA